MKNSIVARTVAAGAAVSLLATGCTAGWGSTGAGGGADTINVLMVNNPQMVDLSRLAHHFTEETGIRVNFTILPENDMRDLASQEFTSQAGTYDVASLSNFEIPIYGKAGWISPLDDYVAADPDFDQDDILAPMVQSLSADDHIFGEPFYGESSFLMYRKDVLEQEGLTMPERPTWQEVAELAAQLDGAEPGMSGICLRGQVGWGQLFAPLTTVVNTFGGTWFSSTEPLSTAGMQAQVGSPEFVEAVTFYVDLVREHGQNGASQSGFVECMNNIMQSNSAMWYDATSAAGSFEAEGSPVRGKMGYAPAPVVETDSSGWLYTWAWAIQDASEKKDAAWEFISWASSKDYEELVGQELGWASVPAGKRASLYENPDYLEQAGAFATAERDAIKATDPTDPGLQPRPAIGIQFVDIPEFPELGTQVSQDVSAAIAGRMSVQEALDRGQRLAEDIAERYEERAAQ